MGSPLSPVIAEIFMEDLEKKAFPTGLLDHHVKIFKRYVDDVFAIAEKGERGTLEPKCSSEILNFVYCSWIGKLQGNVPRVTLGAHCFRSRRGLGKHEAELTGADVCTEWKYGDTTLYRLPIPARKSLWDVKFLLYQPPVTTSRRTNGSKTSTSKAEPSVGIPLNPEGRTGIAGLGMLKSYGKNKMEIPIIVRYHDNVKEVLLCNRQGTEQTFGPLPAFYKRTSTKGMQLAPEGLLMEEYFFGLVKAEYKTRCPSEKFRSAMKPTRRIFNDNLPHPYTTDNAWVKAAIYMVTTEQEPCFDHLDLSHGKNYFHYEWKAFNGTAVSNVRALTKILLKFLSSIFFGFGLLSFWSLLFGNVESYRCATCEPLYLYFNDAVRD
uniref:Reverse transcriptase domain-containing protein n=1 Tax=Trichuris muris TaxID=70415 RepID=A0A5S6QNJ0_TRIMR